MVEEEFGVALLDVLQMLQGLLTTDTGVGLLCYGVASLWLAEHVCHGSGAGQYYHENMFCMLSSLLNIKDDNARAHRARLLTEFLEE